jgi:uncharacterized protein GlcG (DUF336 family)
MKRLAAALLFSAPFFGMISMPAAAQAPMPPAPPAIAADKQIPMDQALAAAQAAIDTCLKLPRPSAATVEIVDLNGLPKVLLSADGARTNSFDYMKMKAHTVIKKGMGSAAYGKTAKLTPGQPLEGDPLLTQYGGGLPIMKNGVMIGAISVSGPTGQVDDDACAAAGLAKFHF